jgi:hypothetical protein
MNADAFDRITGWEGFEPGLALFPFGNDLRVRVGEYENKQEDECEREVVLYRRHLGGLVRGDQIHWFMFNEPAGSVRYGAESAGSGVRLGQK